MFKDIILVSCVVIGYLVGLYQMRMPVSKPVTGKVEKLVHVYREQKHSYVDAPKIIFKPYKSNCIVVISPSDDTFYNTKEGNEITFMLDKRDLSGNPCETELIKEYHLDEKEIVSLTFVFALIQACAGWVVGFILYLIIKYYEKNTNRV